MWSKFTNWFETPALAIDGLVTIGTTILATVFVLAAVLPPAASALMG